MKLQFLGSGDAFGSGGRFNTCILVEAPPEGFLIDCGASSMIAMRRFDIDPNAIATVYLSHLHGDHFAGLPFMILDGQFYSKRTRPLSVVGPPGTAKRLHAAMEVLFPGSSTAPRKFATEVVEYQPGRRLETNGVALTAFEVSHPSGAPSCALRFEVEGRVVCYTGDTEWTEALIEAGQGADLLIAEALSLDRKVKFHLDYATLASRLGEIGAKQVILTHMGPDMLAKRGEVPFTAARDGLVVEI